MLSAPARDFLGRTRVGHLATADQRGAPHVVPVCFAVEDDNLYITIDRKPKGDPRALKRLRNLAENPAAAVVVDRWDEDWIRLGWVMLRGAGEILDDGAEHDRAQALLRALPAIPGDAPRRSAGHRSADRPCGELGQPDDRGRVTHSLVDIAVTAGAMMLQ